MVQSLPMTTKLVLTDIEVGLKSAEIDIHPIPIPDLFICALVYLRQNVIQIKLIWKLQ